MRGKIFPAVKQNEPRSWYKGAEQDVGGTSGPGWKYDKDKRRNLDSPAEITQFVENHDWENTAASNALQQVLLLY